MRPLRTVRLGLGADPLQAIEARGRTIRDPVEKLRLIRRSLEHFEAVDQRLKAIPLPPVRWALYRLVPVDRARPLFSQNPNGALDPPVRRPPRIAPRRHALRTATVLLVAAAGIALAAYPRSRPLPPPPAPVPRVAAPLASDPTIALRAVAPERIWQVEAGPGFELYSNGLRIDTAYAVEGEPRRYRVFHPATGIGAEAHDRPAGILFHTSESDIWPLDEAFNEKLRDSSQNLLYYLRRHRVYHYLIDRFGRVFRVVAEERRANHAGMSVWQDGDQVYLNLNGSFLGICFETRWEGGRALPITRAQLAAGRSLTDHLRTKWGIGPGMCVTHGLTSVNPRKHLIGHHLDWARGFPFEAFGLSDHYARVAPAVALFGFGYDEPFLSVMGEPWPGVKAAERRLEEEAAAAGRTTAALKVEKTALYDRWLAEQARDADLSERQASAGAAAATPGQNPSGG